MDGPWTAHKGIFVRLHQGHADLGHLTLAMPRPFVHPPKASKGADPESKRPRAKARHVATGVESATAGENGFAPVTRPRTCENGPPASCLTDRREPATCGQGTWPACEEGPGLTRAGSAARSPRRAGEGTAVPAAGREGGHPEGFRSLPSSTGGRSRALGGGDASTSPAARTRSLPLAIGSGPRRLRGKQGPPATSTPRELAPRLVPRAPAPLPPLALSMGLGPSRAVCPSMAAAPVPTFK